MWLALHFNWYMDIHKHQVIDCLYNSLLTQNFTMVLLNFEIKALGQKHSGQHIAEILTDIIVDWNLKREIDEYVVW